MSTTKAFTGKKKLFDLNKSLLATFFCLAISVMAIGQEMGKMSTRFGGKLGLNYSYMNFNRGFPPSTTTIPGSWGTGLVAGAFLQVALFKDLFLQPEYLFLTTSSKREDISTTYRFTYLSFPVILKYSLTNRLAVLAGPQFDLLLDAKQSKEITTDITHDTEERAFGLTGGAEFFLSKNLSVGARYTHGLNNIGIGQRALSIIEYKSQQAYLTANYYF